MREKDNKKFWQRFAGIYGPVMNKSSRQLYEGVSSRIGRHLEPDMKVLELACGTGQLSYLLYSQVGMWEATDFSEAMIKEAKKKNHSYRLHFSVQDATKLPYAAESFDAVVISNALHIMPHPEKALAEMKRVVKPDGLLFAPTFVHGESTGFRVRVKLMELVGFHTYHKWSAEELMGFISRQGFRIIEHKVLGDSLAPLCYVAFGIK